MDNQMITALPDVAMAAVDRVPESSAPGEPIVVKPEEKYWNLQMSWQGSVYSIVMGAEDMVYDFRERIQALTCVPPERQKLIGLTKGKLPPSSDSERFGNAGIPHKSGVIKFTMIGTPEKDSFKDPAPTSGVYEDFDVAYPAKSKVAPADDARNLRKVQEKIKGIPLEIINEPRKGKKLLVLDLDYTIVDTEPLLNGGLPSGECARPGMHAFLEKAYEDYDIAIWSQTHWRWLEAKLVELGILGGPYSYRICFVSDRTSMFPIFTERSGKPCKHEVKPLAYLWARFPQWSAKNTIHIDDLSRNFAMNPGEGLKITPFKGAGTERGQRDHELEYLGQYLSKIAQNDDFTTIDHAMAQTLQPRPVMITMTKELLYFSLRSRWRRFVMYYTHPYANPYVVPAVTSPTPVYFILLLGLTFFLWSSSLNNMMPGADKVSAWTLLVLQAAFAILLLTYCANLLGGIRGVNPIELTWVHLTAGMLIFFIMWNYNLASQPPAPEKRSSSSSSSSSAKPSEAPPSKPKEAPKEPDPWENELAHPSAFLTTRKVEPKPWPFPMGLADGKDKLKLWWESGMPSHVGHFNRPLPPLEKKEKEVRKVEDKESKPEPKPEPKPEDKADKPEKPKGPTPEQELEERRKRKEAEAKQLKEAEMAKIAAMAKAKGQYLQDEATKRLWRMRILCFIVGFSLLHKPSAFFMLLAFAMNVISGWLNPTAPPPDPPKAEKISDSRSAERPPELRSRGDVKEASSSSREAKEVPKDPREAALPAKARAARPEPRETRDRPEEAKERPREPSSSKEASRSRSEDTKPRETLREAPKESSSRSATSKEAVDGRSSSSSSKSEVVTSDAIKKASGSTTVTKSNESATQPKIGFGMHYIHSIDKDALMDPSTIPSRGTAHPLMTSLDPGLAN